jgi:Terminase large subunit, T4likevirus-type, N-terminal
MALAKLRRMLSKLQTQVARLPTASHVLDRLGSDPTAVLAGAGLSPDPWQREVLQSKHNRLLMLATRQAGKSTVAAALALHTALTKPCSPVLILSPSTRQSGELFRKVMDLFNALGRPMPVVAESALRVEFGNRSRVLSLPSTEATVRCFSGVSLLVIDEASRVPDSLYFAVRPMLAVSKGRLAALSTPFGKRGWFHDEWHSEATWQRVKITASQCSRIEPAFLEEERRALGERWYRQEYECSFEDVVDAVFAYADIQAALSDDVKPLFAR